MTLRLHDTATRDVRDFVPLEEGKAGIYVCGLTVQSEPHVGHVRSAVNFDVLRRWLTASGYDVTFIRNVTDIDDKILAKGEAQGRPWFEIASRWGASSHRALDAINVLPPTYEPAATGHVPEILELIGQLVAGGHAYPAADGSGDVYFDVRSWPSYGELTRQKIDDMEAAEDADPRGKRDPRDFALWKGWKKALEPETAAWPSPYGPGRPGWHIECSAMAAKYLGPAFDIHGGGVDLRFPHHENELAQSRAAGQAFASYWLHNAWITTAGEKMSKSLGNSLLIPEVLKRVRGIELRYYMVVGALPLARGVLASRRSTTPRSGVPPDRDLPRRGPACGRRARGRLDRGRAGRCRTRSPPPWTTTSVRRLPSRVIHDAVRRATRCLADGESAPPSRASLRACAMLDVLGLDPARPGLGIARRLRRRQARTPPSTPSSPACSRSAPPPAPTRTGPRADAIRDRIAAAGIEVEDTPDGPTWTAERSLADATGNGHQRKGAIRKSSKRPTAGSGGRVRQGLEGKGPTPKAADRPNHKAHKFKNQVGAVGVGAPEASQRRRRRVDRRAQLRGGGAPGRRPGQRRLRRRGHRARRPAARGVQARRRGRHLAARGDPGRAGPAYGQGRAPGTGGADPGVRVRPPDATSSTTRPSAARRR